VYQILKVEKPDIIELGTPYLLPWVAFHHRIQTPCTVVGFYHTDFPTAYVRPTIEKLSGKKTAGFAEHFASKYAKIIYDRCDDIVCSSRIFHQKLSSTYSSPLAYIPLGVDTILFHPGKRNLQLRETLGIYSEEILLIYCGRFDEEKRVNQIISAVELLPSSLNWKLLLIGDGPLKNYLNSQAEKSKKIIILPFITERVKLAELLASADIYVTAGPFETFGLSIVEAQASGLPVVGVKGGALIDRITPETGILGRIDNVQDMAENIMTILSNNLNGMKKAARKQAVIQNDWNKTFDRLTSFYKEIQQLKDQNSVIPKPLDRSQEWLGENWQMTYLSKDRKLTK
jgi:alpha-1,6-mannosyltransferase